MSQIDQPSGESLRTGNDETKYWNLDLIQGCIDSLTKTKSYEEFKTLVRDWAEIISDLDDLSWVNDEPLVRQEIVAPAGGYPQAATMAIVYNDTKSYFEFLVRNNYGSPIQLQAMQAALRDD